MSMGLSHQTLINELVNPFLRWAALAVSISHQGNQSIKVFLSSGSPKLLRFGIRLLFKLTHAGEHGIHSLIGTSTETIQPKKLQLELN